MTYLSPASADRQSAPDAPGAARATSESAARDSAQAHSKASGGSGSAVASPAPATVSESARRPRTVGPRGRAWLLVTLDALLLLVACFALVLFAHERPYTAVVPAMLLVLISLSLNYGFGLYSYSFLNWRTRLATCLFVNVTLATLVVVVLSFFLGEQLVFARKAALLVPVLVPAVLFLGRLAAEAKLHKRLRAQRVLIVGDSDAAHRLAGLIADNPLWALEVIGHVRVRSTGDDDGEQQDEHGLLGGSDLGKSASFARSTVGPCLGSVSQLPAVAAARKPDVLLLAEPGERLDADARTATARARQHVLRMFTATGFVVHYARKVPLDDPALLDWLGEFDGTDKRAYESLKRVADIFAGVLGVVVMLLLTPWVALGTWLSMGTGPFYRQVRLGRGGKPFVLWKFRTMPHDAEADGPRWSPLKDERVSRFGWLLRRFHIDEVPQFLNVLRGDMSLVGPRPERLDFQPLLEAEIPLFRERLHVRPGLTGWAQVNFRYGRSLQDARDKLEYDLYYLRYRSPLLDGAIFLRTVAVVATGRSFPAVPLAYVPPQARPGDRAAVRSKAVGPNEPRDGGRTRAASTNHEFVGRASVPAQGEPRSNGPAQIPRAPRI